MITPERLQELERALERFPMSEALYARDEPLSVVDVGDVAELVAEVHRLREGVAAIRHGAEEGDGTTWAIRRCDALLSGEPLP